jgi:hypothetical protein
MHRVSVDVSPPPASTVTTPTQNAAGLATSTYTSEIVNDTSTLEGSKTVEPYVYVYNERDHFPCEHVITQLTSKLFESEKDVTDITNENVDIKRILKKSTEDNVSLTTEKSNICTELINVKVEIKEQKRLNAESEANIKKIRCVSAETVKDLQNSIETLTITNSEGCKRIVFLDSKLIDTNSENQREMNSLNERHRNQIAKSEEINLSKIEDLKSTANNKTQQSKEQEIKNLRETAGLKFKINMLENSLANNRLAAPSTLQSNLETVTQLANVPQELNRDILDTEVLANKVLESETEIARLETEISILQAKIDVYQQQVVNSQTNYQLVFERNFNLNNFAYAQLKRLNEFCIRVRRGEISITSMCNNELANTWSSPSHKYMVMTIFVCQKENNTKKESDLTQFVINNINQQTITELIKINPEIKYMFGGVALLPLINDAINQVIIQEISINSKSEIVLTNLVSDDSLASKIVNIFISVLKIPMSREGDFLTELDLNDCKEKDQGPFTINAGNKKIYAVPRTGVGLRQLRVYILACKKLSEAGFGFSLFLSDGYCKTDLVPLKQILQEFLNINQCFQISQENLIKIMGEIANKSFNLLFIFSKDGQKLAQVCLPFLQYEKNLECSATCQSFLITNKAIQSFLPFFKF